MTPPTSALTQAARLGGRELANQGLAGLGRLDFLPSTHQLHRRTLQHDKSGRARRVGCCPVREESALESSTPDGEQWAVSSASSGQCDARTVKICVDHAHSVLLSVRGSVSGSPGIRLLLTLRSLSRRCLPVDALGALVPLMPCSPDAMT